MTTTLANPDNATHYYQDTAFETIPHIQLGALGA